jgi:hypothetical protein
MIVGSLLGLAEAVLALDLEPRWCGSTASNSARRPTAGTKAVRSRLILIELSPSPLSALDQLGGKIMPSMGAVPSSITHAEGAARRDR